MNNPGKSSMSPNEALDFIFDLYEIKNEEVAKKSGVHKSIISKYRNGRSDMGTEKLQKILRVLPVEAAAHFNALFVYGIKPNKTFKVAETSSEYKV